MLGTLLLILLLVLLISALPAWPYSRAWGYTPSGTVAAILVMIILLLFLGII
mgnify:CR=1 FL=1